MFFETINSYESHEQVIFCRDKESGLRAIIAIHNTNLGPALGGLRIWNYASEKEALVDVLRLSQGMTYKAACAGLNLGGGKSVIMADPKTMDKKKVLAAFGKFVNSLGGKYITAKDVGVTLKDIEYLKKHCDYVAVAPENTPSIYTAYGVFQGLLAGVEHVWPEKSLKDLTVAIPGAGEGGSFLIDYLVKEGAKILVADINQGALDKIVETYPEVKIVPTNEILFQDCHIFSPCALGGALKLEDVSQYKFKLIAGGANNQLATPEVVDELYKSHITYLPDYFLNAGGLIAVSHSEKGAKEVMIQIKRIFSQMKEILNWSQKKKINAEVAAAEMAEKRIYQKKNETEFLKKCSSSKLSALNHENSHGCE